MRKASSDQSCVVRHQIRDEAARLAQSLRFGETTVRLPEPRLGPLSVVDVDEQVVPADDAPLVREADSAGLKPAVDAIETSSAYFDLEGLTGSDRMS